MRLDRFNNATFNRGKPKWVELLWVVISGLGFATWLPGSSWRRFLLRLFGAKIGVGVIIKPYVRVKFPWKLAIGDYSWIGESVWIDNLDDVTIGSHCCISQNVYFCTGSHRWDTEVFDLETKPIVIEKGCWLSAMVTLAPGTVVGKEAVLGFGFIAAGHYEQATVYRLLNGKIVKKARRQTS